MATKNMTRATLVPNQSYHSVATEPDSQQEDRLMNTFPLFIRSLCATTAAALLLTAAPALADDDHEMPGTAVVKRTPGTSWGQIKTALAVHCTDINSTSNFYGDNTRLYAYELRPGCTEADVQNTITTLVTAGMVVYGESNFTAHAANGQTGSLWVTDIGIGATQFHDQYAGQLLDITGAHTRSQGQGVIVAVVDSGVDTTHEAVQGPRAVWQWDFVDGDAFPVDEGDGIDNNFNGAVDEGVGHGTYVTSLIRLVAPKSKLMHLRVLDSDGQSNAFVLALAIDSAVVHGAQIINVCAATQFNSTALADSVAAAQSQGVIVVGAIGNGSALVPTISEYPAALNECYAVCATDHLDIKAGFSNWGAVADFSAPGSSFVGPTGALNVTTSILGAVPGEGYAHWNGTSLSTALVSGVAALVRAQYPHLPDVNTPAPAVGAFIMGKIGSGAAPIDSLNPAYTGMLGVGRTNAWAATTIGPMAPRIGDVDADGYITSIDLSIILAGWGVCSGDPCAADLDGNSVVDGLDLSVLISGWN